MIYSASRRTDLPAFYPDWIVGKVRRSRKLDALVLWTKDPRNFADHPELSLVVQQVPSVILLTITGLGQSVWEPNVPAPEELRAALTALANRLPAGAIAWRFDPILADATVHARFRSVAQLLRETLGHTPETIISFPDPYAKVKRRLSQAGLSLPDLSLDEKQALLTELRNIGAGLFADDSYSLRLCCEPALIDPPYFIPSRCIDSARFDRLYGTALSELPKDTGQRETCGCARSTEIGSYEQACKHNCLYCYARPEMDPPVIG